MMWILGSEILWYKYTGQGAEGHHQSFPYTSRGSRRCFQSGVAAWLTHRHRPRRICVTLWLGTSSTLAATGILLVDKTYGTNRPVEPGDLARMLIECRFFVRSIAT